jgi:SAM-dependent methyltransferase
MGWTTIEELCDRHLGGRPSPIALTRMRKAEGERQEVRDFVERVLRVMATARFGPNNISPDLAWALGVFVPLFLPGAWGGSVPRFTAEHRHKRIDAYVVMNPWASFGAGTAFLEIGCGFPPYTAVDVARAHPDWRVVGADPGFDEYLLFDEQSNYACLNHEGRIRDFHAGTGDAGAMFKLYNERSATLQRFSELFVKLLPKLPDTADGELTRLEEHGARLIRNPMRMYEAPNLKIIQAAIGAEIAPVDIIRCFNVLCYFDTDFRRSAEDWALRTLRPGGLFICGGDGAQTTDARYTVYRSEEGRLIAKEFAFGIDSLRPFSVVPWYTMHEGERDTWIWAKLVGRLRSDKDFREAYDARLDAMFKEKRLYARDADGFLAPAPDQLPQAEWFNAWKEIGLQLEREDFAERAAHVLRKTGLTVWVNPVGHVAVDPAAFSGLS